MIYNLSTDHEGKSSIDERILECSQYKLPDKKHPGIQTICLMTNKGGIQTICLMTNKGGIQTICLMTNKGALSVLYFFVRVKVLRKKRKKKLNNYNKKYIK